MDNSPATAFLQGWNQRIRIGQQRMSEVVRIQFLPPAGPHVNKLDMTGSPGSFLGISNGTTILENGNDGIAIRLMEMGLTDGEEITLIGFAPLGDPIEFLIRGYRLSLRKAEAKRVTVSAESEN